VAKDFNLTPVTPKWFQPRKPSSKLADCFPRRMRLRPDQRVWGIMGHNPDWRNFKMRSSGKSQRFKR